MGNPYSCPDIVWNQKDKIKKANRDMWKELKENKDGPKTKLELFEYIVKSKQFKDKTFRYSSWDFLKLLNNYMGVPEYKDKIIELFNLIGRDRLPSTIPFKYLHGYGRPKPASVILYSEWCAYNKPTNYNNECILDIRRHYLQVMGHSHTDVETYCSLENSICDYCGSNKVDHNNYIDPGPFLDNRYDGFSVSHHCKEWTCLYCGHSTGFTSDISLVQGTTGSWKPQEIVFRVAS
jgi:hypothetical protein